MADYSSYTKEQLVQEVLKKEESKQKCKEKLKKFHEHFVNAKELIALNKSLNEKVAAGELQQKQRGQELETLKGRVKASDKAKQDVHDAVTQKQHHISSLEQQLQKAHRRADQAELVSKKAEASSAQSATMQQSLQAELDSFRKQLSGLEVALQKLEQRQKDHDEVVSSLKARAGQHNQAQPADSLPSTQACSGDTNDDREQVQLRSNVAQLQQQFDVCQEVQRSMQLEMSNWRVAFSGFTHALNPSADAIATSQLMQISPVGGEGSNIMPRQGSRPDPPELRGLQGSSPPAGVSQVVHQGTPHAGSTAGDGHDVGRHETLGAGSDNMSDGIGTSGSLMQPAKNQPSPGIRLLPSHIPQALQVGVQFHPHPPQLVATLPQLRIVGHDLPGSPKAESPKRKTIALQPGALVPSTLRNRKRQNVQASLEQQAAQKRTHTSAQQHQQQQPQRQQQRQDDFSSSGSLQAYMAKFGIHESDATAVDFLELQMGRITHPDDDEDIPNQAATVSSVARDICCAWQMGQCPQACILAAVVASFLECAAPPAELQTPHSMHSMNPEPGEGSDPKPSRGGKSDPTGVLTGLEQQPMASLWCCSSARKRSSLTWLLQCVAQLDVLLSSPPKTPLAETPQVVGAGPSVPHAPTPKRRGRPPGSRNKKTLQRLGISTAPPPQQQQQQQQQSGKIAPHAQSHGQGRAIEPLKQGAFLSALHQQVLYYLGQACQVKGSGPFESELCCLSAAAAALARLNGKMQAVRVQTLDVLKRIALPTKTKLQCIAAALEVWPEAMTPEPLLPPLHPHSPAPANTCNLTMLCAHATLQSMTQQLLPPQSSAESQPEASKHTDVSDRHKQVLQQWSCSQLTQAAAAQLHGLYHRHWQQKRQQQQLPNAGAVATAAQADRLVTGAAGVDRPHCSEIQDSAACPQLAQHVGAPSWSAAAGALLAELDLLSDGNQSGADVRWQQVQQSLPLAVGCLGWQWAFSQVVKDRLACNLQQLLPKAVSGDATSKTLVKRLVGCLKQVLPVLARQVSHKSTAQSTALQAVLQDVHHSAGLHQQKSLQKLVHNVMSQFPGTAVAHDTAAVPPCQNQNQPEMNPSNQPLPGPVMSKNPIQSLPDAINPADPSSTQPAPNVMDSARNPEPGQLQDIDMPQAEELPEKIDLAAAPVCTVSQPVTEAAPSENQRHHALGVEIEKI